jgi:hypothetical protein
MGVRAWQRVVVRFAFIRLILAGSHHRKVVLDDVWMCLAAAGGGDQGT